MQAMVTAIREAKHYVYIENQFFISYVKNGSVNCDVRNDVPLQFTIGYCKLTKKMRPSVSSFCCRCSQHLRETLPGTRGLACEPSCSINTSPLPGEKTL